MRTIENTTTATIAVTLENAKGLLHEYLNRPYADEYEYRYFSGAQIVEDEATVAETSVFRIVGSISSSEYAVNNFICHLQQWFQDKFDAACTRVLTEEDIAIRRGQKTGRESIRFVIFHNLPSRIAYFAKKELFADPIKGIEENVFIFKGLQHPWETTLRFLQRLLQFQKKAGVKACLVGEETNFSYKVFINEPIDVETAEKDFTEQVRAFEEREAQAKIDAAAEEAAKKKAYAQVCGRLSRKYQIPFINVLRLGHDEEKLKLHADSLRNAKQQLKTFDAETQEIFYHKIFTCGRAKRTAALYELGVYTDFADVNHMDFSMLK